MKYCCLYFDGLFQSYGHSNSFSNNHNTNEFPTRSAITGMICNGLGRYGEQIEFLEKMKNEIKINVYGFTDTNLLDDYQIIGASETNEYSRFTIANGKQLFKANDMKLISYNNKQKRNSTERETNKVVHKYYLIGSKFGVVLFSEDESLLDEIIKAFTKPLNFLYYGRKNCPANHLFVGKFNTLNECLQYYKDNKNVTIKYEITEYDNNSDTEIFLNDVPIKFGEEIVYQPRAVYRKDY